MATKQNAADAAVMSTFEYGGKLVAFRTTRTGTGEEALVLYAGVLSTGQLYCLGELVPMDEDEFYETFNTPEGLTNQDSSDYNGAPTRTEEVS